MIEHITLPGGEIFLTDFNTRDIYNVVSDFCGEEFAEGLRRKIEDMEGYMECCDALMRINDILTEYEYKIKHGREKFSREGVFKLIEEIHRLIGDVI